MKLEELYKIIEDRKKNMPSGSYITSLFREGVDRIAQKVGEEAIEAVIAVKNDNKRRQIEEITDLMFHLFVLMAKLGINLENISKELDKRHVKVS
jgi:phosphoribosyl-ATP pyrophosphohydrolase